MKRKFSFVPIAVFVIMLTSCNGKTDGSQELIDSLQNALNEQKTDYNRLNEFLTVISDGLDSINVQETGIFRKDKESPLPNREQIKRDLTQYRQTLKEQRNRISDLEKQLKEDKKNSSKLSNIINALRTQLQEKETRIAQLEKELENSNMSIAQLQASVSSLNQQNALQEETISTQDKILNECYYLIASKKELKSQGIVSGGNIFKKRKVNLSELSIEQFKAVDIRDFKQIQINGKNVKILSPAPANSYKLNKTEGGYILTVNDATAFWSISNYLVIQAD